MFEIIGFSLFIGGGYWFFDHSSELNSKNYYKIDYPVFNCSLEWTNISRSCVSLVYLDDGRFDCSLSTITPFKERTKTKYSIQNLSKNNHSLFSG